MDSFELFTALLTVVYFVVSAGQAQSIYKTKSATDIPFFPFLATYLNAMLWTKYGIMLNDQLLVLTNALGVITSIIAIIIYYIYSSEKSTVEKKFLNSLLFLMCFFLLIYHEMLTINTVGIIAMLSSILMFASPLFSIVLLFNKQPVSRVNLDPFSMITLLVSMVWTIYGLRKADYNVITPNVLGTILGFFLITLRIVIPSSGKPLLASFYKAKERSSYDPLIELSQAQQSEPFYQPPHQQTLHQQQQLLPPGRKIVSA